jgi:hypothetical protein
MDSATRREKRGARDDRYCTSLDNERFRQRARAENLHDGRAPLRTAHEPSGEERRWRDGLASFVCRFKSGKIHGRGGNTVCPDAPRAILAESATLRKFLNEVAGFRADFVSRTRRLPFAAAARGLASFATATNGRILLILGTR